MDLIRLEGLGVDTETEIIKNEIEEKYLFSQNMASN